MQRTQSMIGSYNEACVDDTLESAMSIVTVSPKYQVVIPGEVRQAAGIVPGQKVQILLHQGRIELVPLRPMAELRGFAAGIDTRLDREVDRV